MKLFHSLPLVFGLANASALLANECKTKLQNKLSKCSTATGFCSSLLGYNTATGNHTLTIYTTTKETTLTTSTKTDGRTTVFVTDTVYIATKSTTTTITSSVSTATVTYPSATGSPTCFISTLSEASRGAPLSGNVAAKQTSTPVSCGFAATQSDAASTACMCFVDTHTTVTVTNYKTVVVKGTPTVTLTHFNTYTSTIETTTYIAPTTKTVTLQACPTPPSSCNNTGLQWGYYTALSGAGYPSNSDTFDPALYKTDIPIINGTTQIVSVAYTGSGSGSDYFYGKGPEPLSSYFINHRGYFYAPQTGNYTLNFDFVDDAAFTWIGDLAYSGWNMSNWDMYATWSSALPTIQVAFTAGDYVPIRFAFGQGGGAGGLGVEMYAPDGETVMTSKGNLTASPYLVSFSCDGTAPAYPPFGSET